SCFAGARQGARFFSGPFPSLPLLLRLAHLDRAHDVLGVQAFGSVLHTAKKAIRSAARITAIERAFAFAMLTRQNVVANENFAADGDALGVGLAAARIEPWLAVHFTSPLCVKK